MEKFKQVQVQEQHGSGLVEGVTSFTDIYNERECAVIDLRLLKMMFKSLSRVGFSEMKEEIIRALSEIDNKKDFYEELKFAITQRENIDAMDEFFNSEIKTAIPDKYK